VGGSAFTDAYVEQLQALAKTDATVVLTGAQTGETLHALFANSYAVVHPSLSEGLPIAVLEAMGYGKCVLSSDIPESLEVVEGHGLTFKADDMSDLSRAMGDLLAHPEIAKAVGAEARDFVAKNYDWNDIGAMTSYLYEYLDYDWNKAMVEQKIA
jgi:glycosyltransferase involved in cell wall biosynthesis